jgi:hypothetical protein
LDNANVGMIYREKQAHHPFGVSVLACVAYQ